MTDLLFDFFIEDMNLDLVVKNGEIQGDESLLPAVLVSLFTDARCEKTELPKAETSQRGYFGDAVSSAVTGSKLWLLNRTKYNNETLIKAKEYAQDALAWLVTDGLAKDVQVETYFKEQKRMALNVSIFKNNNDVETFKLNL